MFLIDYFDPVKYSMVDCAIALHSRHNGAINYFWNGIYYFDTTKMKNLYILNWNCCKDCDTGGMTKEWLKKQMGNTPLPTPHDIQWADKDCRINDIHFIKPLTSGHWDITQLPTNLQSNVKLVHFLTNDVRNENNKLFCEIYDNVFLHYRAGGNWRQEGLELHSRLTYLLRSALL
jgi:hypothetical protein